MQRIDVDTDRIRTSVWTNGPEDGVPVLLIHGNLCTGRFWQDVANKLPKQLSVAAPDLRGFGRTEPKPIDATRGLDDWTDDVESLVRALGWEGKQLHVGAWSMGGGTRRYSGSSWVSSRPSCRARKRRSAPLSRNGSASRAAVS